MPAPTGPIVGIDFLVTAGGNTIGGRRGATLNLGSDTEDITNADQNSWQQTLNNLRDWGIDFDALWLEGTTPAAISGQGATFEVFNETLSTPAYETLQHVRAITIDVEADPIQIASQTTGRDPENLYGVRSVALSVDAYYVDPENNSPLDFLFAQRDAGADVDCKATWGAEGSEIQADWTIADIALDAPYDDAAALSLSLDNNGTVTQAGTNRDVGLDALLAALFAEPPTDLAVVFKTAATGATQWNGDAIITALSIEIPFDGAVNVSSGSLLGDGALARGLTV